MCNKYSIHKTGDLSGTYFDHVGSYIGDHGRVSLHYGWKAHLKLSFGVACPLHDGLGLLTPGDEQLVVIHISHHLIHLQHRVPEAT